MAVQSTSRPSHLEPSPLGTKEYWDTLYTTEITNHKSDPSDVGTIWFDDSSAEDKVHAFLSSQIEKDVTLCLSKETCSFLDLGTGNGHFLFRLREGAEEDCDDDEESGPFRGRMMGVDYSRKSVEFARRIAQEKGIGKGQAGEVEFELWDIMNSDPNGIVLTGANASGWDVVLDKGTFDAISLSEETDAAGRRICEGYRERVVPLVKEGGLLLVTSCNWTEEELRTWFEGPVFKYWNTIKYRSFSFGGQKGQTISSQQKDDDDELASIMRSTATSTCRRCLSALKTRGCPSKSSYSPAGMGHRTISTDNSNSNRSKLSDGKDGSDSYSGKELGKRRASTSAQPYNSDSHIRRFAPNSVKLPTRRLLKPDELFHCFSNSPLPAIRKRAEFMRTHAYCPHPDHRQTRVPNSPDDLEGRKSINGKLPPAHVSYECPDCGIPVACCEEHLVDDYEAHLEICDQLREINEDDHDLRSGRDFPEFEYPNYQQEEFIVNYTNWDTFLYTRQFEAMNEERSLRQATKLLTYPITIGSVLNELSPYNLKDGRLTIEGLKSFSALRYNLHPAPSGGSGTVKGLRPTPPSVRIFVLGARAESSLPREVWFQLAYLFPRATFHLILIGPESMMNRDNEFPLPPRTPRNPFGAIVESRMINEMRISTYVEYYHTLHEAQHFYPYDPYFDCFVMFHPGLGHPASSHEWQATIPQLLETKVPVLVTGYTQYDMERDVNWINQQAAGEFDLLLEPGENRFRSLRWDLNDMDPHDISAGNWGVWAFRGKRYETTRKDVD